MFESASFPRPSQVNGTALFQADKEFVERIEQRLKERELTDKARMWMSRDEIRMLRRIIGMNTSTKWMQKLKNRRMRVKTVQLLLSRAEDKLAERAAALVAEKIMPPSRIFSDEKIRTAWSKALYVGVIKTDQP